MEVSIEVLGGIVVRSGSVLRLCRPAFQGVVSREVQIFKTFSSGLHSGDSR